MNSSQKNKLTVLAIAVFVLAGAGIGAAVMLSGNDRPAAEPQSVATELSPEQATLHPTVDDGLILVSGGTYLMGSPDSERQRQEDERQHKVTISDFYVDPYEVTQRDYTSVTGENPSIFEGGDLPVENVTWYDAIKYCNARSARCGLTPAYSIKGHTVSWNRSANGYRLLTEAEWEYVTRAGTSTIYNFGNQVHSDLCNFEGSYPYLIEENYVQNTNPEVVTSYNRGRTIAVSELAPNAFGLYNTHGNVSEWCFDYYGDYDGDDSVNPVGAVSGCLRVNRGGGYNDFGKHLRSAYRSATNPVDADQNLGFRICRTATAVNGPVETVYSLDIAMPKEPKILIAYFSYSGNTESAAELLREKTGADIIEITMENPYSGNIYDVSQKDLNGNVHPALTTVVANMEQYDVILLGYPTWWATMPMPVFTFLESYDFSGKSIFSFSSHGGTMFGDSVSDLSKKAVGAYVGCGFEFNYSGGNSLSGDLSQWLSQCGIAQR